MSFSLTTEQVRNQTKTVTRRLGWWDLKPGDELRAVEKGMGLKKGEKMKQLAIIRVVSVGREPLLRMLEDYRYGREECRKEGFPKMTPHQFVVFFCKTHQHNSKQKLNQYTVVNRIEFEYV